jgi:type II secretion system protein J
LSDSGRQSRGFTLLELLVATAMMAVLAGSLYATLQTAFKARRTAYAAVADIRAAELAVELVRTDLTSAVGPRGILAGGFLGEDAIDRSGQPMDALMLHCTAGGAEDTSGAGDVRMIELECSPDESGQGMTLVRRVTRYLLATLVAEPPEEVLCRNVRSLDLKYFNGTDWQDAWDSADQGDNLPLAVKVTLELLPDPDRDEEAGYVVSRIFTIPCAVLPEESTGAMP